MWTEDTKEFGGSIQAFPGFEPRVPVMEPLPASKVWYLWGESGDPVMVVADRCVVGPGGVIQFYQGDDLIRAAAAGQWRHAILAEEDSEPTP